MFRKLLRASDFCQDYDWEILTEKIISNCACDDRVTCSDCIHVESHQSIAPELQLATTGVSATFVISMSGQMNDVCARVASPLISIVIATYNSKTTLQQCIDSVAQQTYPHKELIVIDGGSKDGTVEVLEGNVPKVSYWLSEPDRGIYHAWNKGLARAEGEWICFLGADDVFWDITVLTQISEPLKTLSFGIRVVYGQNMLVNGSGVSLYPMGASWDTVKDKFWAGMCLPHPGMMHHRSLFEQHGKFDESFRIAGDYEMLLRELKHADALFIPNLIIAGVGQGGISSNPSSALLVLAEARRAQRMHGQRLPSLLWIWSMIKVHLRFLLWRLLGEQVARTALDVGRRILLQPRHWTKT